MVTPLQRYRVTFLKRGDKTARTIVVTCRTRGDAVPLAVARIGGDYTAADALLCRLDPTGRTHA